MRPRPASPAPEPARLAAPALDAATRGAARARGAAREASARAADHAGRAGATTRGRARRAALFASPGGARGRHPLRARVVGVTGTPGVGQVDADRAPGARAARATTRRCASRCWRSTRRAPSRAARSWATGCARTSPSGEPRIFFRSQATQGDLGGVGRRTFAVTRLLRHLFDFVFVETVGIGQSEIEITRARRRDGARAAAARRRPRPVPEGRRHGRPGPLRRQQVRRGARWRGGACTSCARRCETGTHSDASAHRVFQTSALRGTRHRRAGGVPSPDGPAARRGHAAPARAAFPRAGRSPSATASFGARGARSGPRRAAIRGARIVRSTRSSRTSRWTRSAPASGRVTPTREPDRAATLRLPAVRQRLQGAPAAAPARHPVRARRARHPARRDAHAGVPGEEPERPHPDARARGRHAPRRVERHPLLPRGGHAVPARRPPRARAGAAVDVLRAVQPRAQHRDRALLATTAS